MKYLLGLFVFYGSYVQATDNFFSVTIDNDVFVGKDNGYTNGVFFSIYNVGPQVGPSFLVSPLMWSMPKGIVYTGINVNSFGQTLMTPEDISLANPPEDDLPYAGLIKYTNAYIAVGQSYSDWVSTSIGLVGPDAKGEQAQNEVHKAIGVQLAQGWDTQLKNEVVFGFTRGRARRVISVQSDVFDLLAGGQISLGTLESGFSLSLMLRIGQNLSGSYASALLADSRVSNPIAVEKGWFIYAGVSGKHIANQIFTDGNTFRDSRSIDYDRNINVFTAGIASALGGNGTLTLAFNTSFNNSTQTERLNRYGTLTFGWEF